MRFLIIFVVMATGFASMAQQPDPSSLTYAGGSHSADEGMESQRYVKKPGHPKKKKKRAVASEPQQTPDTGKQNPQVTPLPALSPENFNAQTLPQPTPAPVSDPNSSFGQRMRDLFLGGDLELIDRYRSFLDMEDIRKNVFEFTLASTYLYNTSMSPYFFRNYVSAGPGAFLGLDLWLTPFLSIDADYKFSLLNGLKDSPTQETYVSSTHEWFDLGVKFRRFFGMTLTSSSLVVGLKYADYKLTVPPAAQYRLSQHVRGPELSIDLSVPASRVYFWNFGFMIQPFMSQDETVAANDVRAGASNQTVGYGANLGGEYRLSRQTRAFFKLSTVIYRSQFSGMSSGIDPVTGSTASNVQVTNVFYFIDLGVKLGR